MSAKKEEKIAQDNAALAVRMQQELDTVAQHYAAIEKMQDPAEKILELKDFLRKVSSAKFLIQDLEDAKVRKRAGRTPMTYAKRTALTTASLFVIPLVVTGMMDWTAVSSQRKERKKLRAVIDTPALMQKVDDLRTAAQKRLDEITARSDLAALAASPHFSKAYKDHEPLRDRFTAVAAARAAIGDAPASQQTERDERPAAETTAQKPAAQKPAAQKPAPGAYDHLRKGL